MIRLIQRRHHLRGLGGEGQGVLLHSLSRGLPRLLGIYSMGSYPAPEAWQVSVFLVLESPREVLHLAVSLQKPIVGEKVVHM
jgi:hypothetical protein